MTKALDDAELLINHSIHLPSQTIMLTGEVDADMYETLIMGLTLITNKKNKLSTITIELNSGGGDWYSGMAIFDRIQACELNTKIIVSGSAMSMASIILQSANQRLVTRNSSIMIHDGESGFTGSQKNLEAWTKHFSENNDRMYKIYTDRSSKTIKYWKAACKLDSIYTAEQALELGLVDRIIE